MNSQLILPEYISYFLNVTPYFLSISASSYSGREIRKLHSLETKYLYLISNAQISMSDFLHFYKFFTSCFGSFKSFYVKNFLDYKVLNESMFLADNNKLFLYKPYTIDKTVIRKKITSPIQNSIKLTFNGQKLNFVFNQEECCVQVLDKLPPNAQLEISFEFFSEVRFADDYLRYEFLPNHNIKLGDIKLKQL